MRTLDIRSLLLGIALLAVVAIGTFVALGRGDDTAQAAPQPSLDGAAPQGAGIIRDPYFECASYGVVTLLDGADEANYYCSSDAAENIDCLWALPGNSFNCSDGTNNSGCGVTNLGDTQADCTDTDGSEHTCVLGEFGVTCSTNDASVGKDFVSCSHSSPFKPHTCGTEDGPFVCFNTGESLFKIACGTLTSIPDGKWGDVDCNGAVAPRDGQLVLNAFLGKPPASQTEPCPDPGSTVSFEANSK